MLNTECITSVTMKNANTPMNFFRRVYCRLSLSPPHLLLGTCWHFEISDFGVFKIAADKNEETPPMLMARNPNPTYPPVVAPIYYDSGAARMAVNKAPYIICFVKN